MTSHNRPTPMTLEQARAFLAKEAARLARMRDKRRARKAEARRIVAEADAKVARK
jgi:hypothetical protein